MGIEKAVVYRLHNPSKVNVGRRSLLLTTYDLTYRNRAKRHCNNGRPSIHRNPICSHGRAREVLINGPLPVGGQLSERVQAERPAQAAKTQSIVGPSPPSTHEEMSPSSPERETTTSGLEPERAKRAARNQLLKGVSHQGQDFHDLLVRPITKPHNGHRGHLIRLRVHDLDCTG